MEFTLKANLPKNLNTGFVRGELKVKVRNIKHLEESIDYNNGYILLNVISGDNGNYLQINDYAGKVRKKV